MMGRTLLLTILVALTFFITSCSHLFSTETSLPSTHPEALGEGRVACSECHKDEQAGTVRAYDSFSHSALFVRNHRYYASGNDYVCATCHKVSFCNDCHMNKVEMKPSIRY